MSERYSKLFALPENLYASDSPVVIVAGALLKDNQTGKVIAQVKIRNINNKAIKAARVCIRPLDTVGNPLAEETEYQYLDLNVSRNEAFGQKTPIALADATARSFSASVVEIIFVDNSIWHATGATWDVLPSPISLNYLGDAELVKQFRLKYGNDCEYLPQIERDLWYCTCGELNRHGEVECYRCKKSSALLNQIDIEELRKEKEARVSAEKEQAEKETAAAQAKAKKISKIAAIVTPILVILIVIAVLVSQNIAYNNALALMGVGEYADASSIFESLGNYQDSSEKLRECQYHTATELMSKGEFRTALSLFYSIGDYKDASEKIIEVQKCIEKETIKKCKAGDYIIFGTYEQDSISTNGAEDIEWLVLEVKDGKALLVSKHVLDYQSYHTSSKDITWENSSIRKWLNSTFINTAFSTEESNAIATVLVPADENPDHRSTDPGNATRDKVFLLSLVETNKYFRSNDAKVCYSTPYAASKDPLIGSTTVGSFWILRTPGWTQKTCALVSHTGDTGGRTGVDGKEGIRPAMWIDLNKL